MRLRRLRRSQFGPIFKVGDWVMTKRSREGFNVMRLSEGMVIDPLGRMWHPLDLDLVSKAKAKENQ